MLKCYLSEKTACLRANPENFVSRCSNQQMFRGGWREADLQRRIQAGALHIQNTHIYVKQLHRDGMDQWGHMDKVGLYCHKV